MKKLSVLLLTIFICAKISAQKEEYDKNYSFVWETDSVFISKDYIGDFTADMIGVSFRANKLFGMLTIQNKADKSFDMDWDYIHIELNDDTKNYYEIDKKVDYTQKKQIEKVPKNGKVWQQINNCFSNQFYNMKEIKAALKNKNETPVKLLLRFAIIYNEEEVKIEVRKTGKCIKQ